MEQLSSLLQELGLQASSDVVLGLVEATASTPWTLNLDETYEHRLSCSLAASQPLTLTAADMRATYS